MTVQFTSGEFRRLPRTVPPSRTADLLRRRRVAVAVGLAVVLSFAVILATILRQPSPASPDEPGREALAPPAWTPVARPVPAFALDLSGLFEKPVFGARVHSEGGGREDVFEAGKPGAPGGFLRLVAYRPGSEARPSPTFFLFLARSAAEEGFAVPRSGVGAPLATKLGPLEAAEVTLAGDGQTHSCLAWRYETDAADLKLSGWLCAGAGRAVTRAELACLVDRLDLSPGTADRALKDLFAAADKHRTPGCAPPRPSPPPATQRRAA